jgi:hypothetical protein
VSRASDLTRLGVIATELEAAQVRAALLFEERRAIFARRVVRRDGLAAVGDCTKVELAEAARTTRLNVAAALKPKLVKAGAKRRKEAARRDAAA